MENKYYPIGTVVLLKGGERPIMIYGRKQMQATTRKIWDYVACLYPEGNIGEKYNVFFQGDSISKVLHMGMNSEKDREIQERLIKLKFK